MNTRTPTLFVLIVSVLGLAFGSAAGAQGRQSTLDVNPRHRDMKRMKATVKTRTIVAGALTCALTATITSAQTIDTRIGKLDFEMGVPTQETAAKLYDEMDFQRAVQSYLWGLPSSASR